MDDHAFEDIAEQVEAAQRAELRDKFAMAAMQDVQRRTNVNERDGIEFAAAVIAKASYVIGTP